MTTHTYGKHDYAFGQAMLTLRTEIGLTQAGLAQVLGVSRGTVLGWEAGRSYPKAKHLKCFIAFGVKQRAFPAGREERRSVRYGKRRTRRWCWLSCGSPPCWANGLLSQPREPVQVHYPWLSLLPVDGWSGRRWMSRVSMGARRNWPPLSSG